MKKQLLKLILPIKWLADLLFPIKKIKKIHQIKQQMEFWHEEERVTMKQAFARAYTCTTQTFVVKKIDVGSCPYEGWNDEYYRIHF